MKDFEKAFRKIEKAMEKLEDNMGTMDDKLNETFGGNSTGATIQAGVQNDITRLKAQIDQAHGERRKKYNMPPKSKKPSISISGGGSISINVGDNRKHKHAIRLTDDKTDSYFTLCFNDDNNYSLNGTGVVPQTDYIIARIRAHLRKRLEGMEESAPVHDHLKGTMQDRLESQIRGKKQQVYHSPYVPTEPPTLEELFAKLKTGKKHTHEEPMDYSIFYARTLFGKQGKPMDIREDAEVSVSGHNIFGRKYEVRIDGDAIYVPFLEKYMDEICRTSNIDIFMVMRSGSDRVILGKIFKALIALDIAEPHHIAINEFL